MPIDPRHQHLIPAGRDLGRLLRIVFRQIGNTVAHHAWHGTPTPDLRHWQDFIVKRAAPILFSYRLRAARRMFAVIRRVERHGKSDVPLIVKAPGDLFSFGPPAPSPFGVGITPDAFAPPPAIEFNWQVFLREVADAAQTQAMNFARSTLETSAYDAAEAYSETRRELAEGLEAAEALDRMAQRIGRIFTNPEKAFRIAATESSNASHGGEITAQRESGVVWGNEWLASSDACEKICEPLDGKRVALGEPFLILPKNKPPYNVVYHPTAHPFCQCSMSVILK